MSDFLSGLGGFIKGIQPLMGEEAQGDASMNALLLHTDVSQLRDKRRDVLARIGEEVCQTREKYPQFGALCDEADVIEKQLAAKQAEMDDAKKAAEEQQRAQQRERDARTCADCGFENEPGVKFCGECGGKLALPQDANCPQCGVELKPGVKFCGECGMRL